MHCLRIPASWLSGLVETAPTSTAPPAEMEEPLLSGSGTIPRILLATFGFYLLVVKSVMSASSFQNEQAKEKEAAEAEGVSVLRRSQPIPGSPV